MRTKEKYSKERLEKLAKESVSIAEMLRKMKISDKGGNYQQ
jgi:hypothetical protein